MAISFENPPLVELIAELRWGIPSILPASQQSVGFVLPIPTVPSSRLEEFFMRFGSRIAADGFGRFERVVPPGFPLLPFQPVYRFRKVGEEAGTTLYQLGSGLFSANITPPYQSWTSFEPIVTRGVELLLECRDENEKHAPFHTASVRYINAFSAALTEGRSIGAFMSEILGIEIRLPEILTKQLAADSEVTPVLQLTIPAIGDRRMALNIAEGLVNNEPAIIMDTTVSSTRETPPLKDGAIKVLNAAHDLIHQTFIELTEKLHSLMKLRNNSADYAPSQFTSDAAP